MARISTEKITGLIGWLLVVFTAAFIGAVASIEAPSFYTDLVQPAWAPPSWVFGPVWTVLYAMMGVAAWLVWSTENNPKVGVALIFFMLQLVLNALWSWLFFVWHLGGLAFLDTVVLLVAITATIRLFWSVNRGAGALLVPYLLWVGFACGLNYAVWQLNPGVLG